MPELKNHTDQELLCAIRNDDEKAFAELFRRHWKRVHAMTYSRVRSEVVAEEIVQELFVALWEKRATQNIKHLPSYLYQAVKFKTLNHLDSILVQRKYWEYYKNFIPQREHATEMTVEYNDLLEAIEEGMKTLPEKSQKVFRLNRLEGRSVADIASHLNLSEKAIQYHLTQSLKKLRVHLRNYIFTITVVLTAALPF